MGKINNKNGIEMYWERAEDIDKINILDSNGHYFNDMCFDTYEDDNGQEDIGAILHTLEETTLENMCNFFNASIYETLEELADKENLRLDGLIDNDYLNVFNVNGQTYYTWSW